jgi:hypothetical protein
MAVFWVLGLPGLVEVCQLFRRACCLDRQGGLLVITLMMDAAKSSETSITFH